LERVNLNRSGDAISILHVMENTAKNNSLLNNITGFDVHCHIFNISFAQELDFAFSGV